MARSAPWPAPDLDATPYMLASIIMRKVRLPVQGSADPDALEAAAGAYSDSRLSTRRRLLPVLRERREAILQFFAFFVVDGLREAVGAPLL